MKKAFIIVLFFMQQLFIVTVDAQTTEPTIEKTENNLKLNLNRIFQM